MDFNTADSIIDKALKHFGLKDQTLKTIEECPERIQALLKDDMNNILEEIVDVQLMLFQKTIDECAERIQALLKDDMNNILEEIVDVQMSSIFTHEQMQNKMDEKLKRLEQRIESEQENV